MAYVDGARELGGKGKVGVVESNNELALLVERVLEVYACWLCSGRTLYGTLYCKV